MAMSARFRLEKSASPAIHTPTPPIVPIIFDVQSLLTLELFRLFSSSQKHAPSTLRLLHRFYGPFDSIFSRLYTHTEHWGFIFHSFSFSVRRHIHDTSTTLLPVSSTITNKKEWRRRGGEKEEESDSRAVNSDGPDFAWSLVSSLTCPTQFPTHERE